MCANADWQDCMWEKASAVWLCGQAVGPRGPLHLSWATVAFFPPADCLLLLRHVEKTSIYSIHLSTYEGENDDRWTSEQKFAEITARQTKTICIIFPTSCENGQARLFGFRLPALSDNFRTALNASCSISVSYPFPREAPFDALLLLGPAGPSLSEDPVSGCFKVPSAKSGGFDYISFY